MGIRHLAAAAATLGLVVTLGACANDSFLGTSGSTAALPEKPKVDPACATLASKIDELRKDGVADRVEQAAQGKGTTVSVKRESLTKVAELNKANAEYQQRCSTYSPAPGAAKAATLTTGAGAAPAAAGATKGAAPAKAPPPAAKSAAAGVTVSPSGVVNITSNPGASASVTASAAPKQPAPAAVPKATVTQDDPLKPNGGE